MERPIPFVLLLTLLLCVSVGCRRQSAGKTGPMEEWLADDTEEALKRINRTCTTFYFNKQLDSVKEYYCLMFRNFPDKPVGNPDTLVHETAIAMTYLSNAFFYSKEGGAVLSLFDSLRHSGHPFLTGPCLGYLLAYQAYMLGQLDKEKAIEPARTFAALPPQTDQTQELMCCNIVSWILWSSGASSSEYIAMQLRAVDAYRKGGKLANITAVLSRMSFFYRLAGQYDKAIEYSLEALDWEMSHNKGRKNSGTIQMYGDLSSVYSQLFLFDKAFDMIDLAISSSHEYGDSHLCDLYRMKAALFNSVENTDSTLYYMNMAIQTAGQINSPQYMNVSAKDKACYFVQNYNLYADSLPQAVKVLEQCYADSTLISLQHHVDTRLWYGRALSYMGQTARGKKMMEQAIREMQQMQWSEGVYDASRALAFFYAEQGMGHELAELFPVYDAMRDSIENENKVNASIGANVRYETGRKEQENRALAAEVSLKEQSLVYTRVILTLSILLLLGAVCLIIQYRRLRRQERESHLNDMNRLLLAQRELNRRNETLSAELEQAAHTEVIDTVRQQLNPSLLSGDDEVRFRQSFAALHPRYLPRLRNRCPEITKSDELVCMLVYLRQNTDEIALALGISRASVNSARSRIRKKLSMQKEESLDEYLQGMS